MTKTTNKLAEILYGYISMESFFIIKFSVSSTEHFTEITEDRAALRIRSLVQTSSVASFYRSNFRMRHLAKQTQSCRHVTYIEIFKREKEISQKRTGANNR